MTIEIVYQIKFVFQINHSSTNNVEKVWLWKLHWPRGEAGANDKCSVTGARSNPIFYQLTGLWEGFL